MMDSEPVAIVRGALEAFIRNDLVALCEYVDPDLEWTYLDPTSSDPIPQTCRGRHEIEKAAGTWARLGLRTEVEELDGTGDKVLAILHAPGLDEFRARTAGDRNFHVVTVKDGKVTAIRACIDRADARARAGLT